MWFVVILLVAVICLVIYQDYLRFNSRKWKLLSQFPGDRPLPLIGNAIQTGLDSDEMSHRLMLLWKKHGKQTFRVTVGSEDWVLLCDPEDVAIILSHPTEISKPLERNAAMHPFFGDSISSSEGERWKLARKFVTTSFNFKTADQRLDTLNKNCERLISILDEDREKGHVDMYRYLKAFMFDSVSTTLMGVDYNLIDDLDNPYLVTGKNVIAMLTANYFAYWRTIPPLFALTPMYQEMMTAIRNIRNVSEHFITTRKSILDAKNSYNKEKKLNATKNSITEGENKVEECLLDKFLNSNFTDELISEEISIICFAAHYTTSLTMSHALYFIAKYPEIQRRVMEEQLSIFQHDKLKKPSNEDLNEMKYLDAVIKETLRVIPTVAKIGRQLHEDLRLSDGRIVPAGASVVVFYEALFLNDDLFAEPHKFNPDRFFGNTEIRPYSYVPFSAGPRNCIGAKYASMAMKGAISNIIRRFELLEGPPGTEPQIVNRMLTESKNGVQLLLKPRIL